RAGGEREFFRRMQVEVGEDRLVYRAHLGDEVGQHVGGVARDGHGGRRREDDIARDVRTHAGDGQIAFGQRVVVVGGGDVVREPADRGGDAHFLAERVAAFQAVTFPADRNAGRRRAAA